MKYQDLTNRIIRAFCDADECQLINYLKATEAEVGLLLNFGRRPEIRRKIFDNDYKKIISKKSL